MASEKPQGITLEETKNAIRVIAGDIFELFKKEYPVDKSHYWLNTRVLVCAIQNSVTHINRAGIYHSDTGANKFKKAAYMSKAIAAIRPVQVASSYPLNLTNHIYLDFLMINSTFAVHVLEALLGNIQLYGQLLRDIRYCFEFRSRIDEDALAMLLEHALEHSPKYFKSA